MNVIKTISKENFQKFGKVIEFSADVTEKFEIVVKEEGFPWRVAVFRYTNKSTAIFENHPESMETFEPLSGITLLLVAENADPQQYEAFILDKPVCLDKGVWHQVIALSEEASVKITENLNVSSIFFEFDKEIYAVAEME